MSSYEERRKILNDNIERAGVGIRKEREKTRDLIKRVKILEECNKDLIERVEKLNKTCLMKN